MKDETKLIVIKKLDRIERKLGYIGTMFRLIAKLRSRTKAKS